MFQKTRTVSLFVKFFWLINDETNFLKAGKAKFLGKAVDEPHVDWLLLFTGWKSWIPWTCHWPTPRWSGGCCRALLFAPPWVVPGVIGIVFYNMIIMVLVTIFSSDLPRQRGLGWASGCLWAFWAWGLRQVELKIIWTLKIPKKKSVWNFIQKNNPWSQVYSCLPSEPCLPCLQRRHQGLILIPGPFFQYRRRLGQLWLSTGDRWSSALRTSDDPDDRLMLVNVAQIDSFLFCFWI